MTPDEAVRLVVEHCEELEQVIAEGGPNEEYRPRLEALRVLLAEREQRPRQPTGHHSSCGHDAYWLTIYGHCMACDRKAAEQRAEAAEAKWKLLASHNDGHPAMCCGRCADQIKAAETRLREVEAEAALRTEEDR